MPTDLSQISVNVKDTVPPENFATVDKGNLVGTVYTKEQEDEWRTGVEAEIQSGVKGIAIPNLAYDPVTNPIPTPYDPADFPNGLYEKYDVKQDGIFPNFLDVNGDEIEVTPAQISANQAQIWVTNGIAELILKPMPQATKTIPQFADLNFPVTNPSVGEKVQCVENFIVYQLLDGQTSTSANTPSTSPTIWRKLNKSTDLDAYTNDTGVKLDTINYSLNDLEIIVDTTVRDNMAISAFYNTYILKNPNKEATRIKIIPHYTSGSLDITFTRGVVMSSNDINDREFLFDTVVGGASGYVEIYGGDFEYFALTGAVNIDYLEVQYESINFVEEKTKNVIFDKSNLFTLDNETADGVVTSDWISTDLIPIDAGREIVFKVPTYYTNTQLSSNIQFRAFDNDGNKSIIYPVFKILDGVSYVHYYLDANDFVSYKFAMIKNAGVKSPLTTNFYRQAIFIEKKYFVEDESLTLFNKDNVHRTFPHSANAVPNTEALISSGYIALNFDDSLELNIKSGSLIRVFEFDVNFNPLGRWVNCNSSRNYTVQNNNTKYVRVGFYNVNDLDTFVKVKRNYRINDFTDNDALNRYGQRHLVFNDEKKIPTIYPDVNWLNIDEIFEYKGRKIVMKEYRTCNLICFISNSQTYIVGGKFAGRYLDSTGATDYPGECVFIKRSKDKGLTWSGHIVCSTADLTTDAFKTDIQAHAITMVVDKNNRIHCLFGSGINFKNAIKSYPSKYSYIVDEANDGGHLLHLWSDDDGINWLGDVDGFPIDISTSLTSNPDFLAKYLSNLPAARFIMPTTGNGVCTKNGTIVIPSTYPRAACFIYSLDNGSTWLVNYNTTTAFNFEEAGLTEYKDNSILIASRPTSQGVGYTRQVQTLDVVNLKNHLNWEAVNRPDLAGNLPYYVGMGEEGCKSEIVKVQLAKGHVFLYASQEDGKGYSSQLWASKDLKKWTPIMWTLSTEEGYNNGIFTRTYNHVASRNGEIIVVVDNLGSKYKKVIVANGLIGQLESLGFNETPRKLTAIDDITFDVMDSSTDLVNKLNAISSGLKASGHMKDWRNQKDKINLSIGTTWAPLYLGATANFTTYPQGVAWMRYQNTNSVKFRITCDEENFSPTATYIELRRGFRNANFFQAINLPIVRSGGVITAESNVISQATNLETQEMIWVYCYKREDITVEPDISNFIPNLETFKFEIYE